MPIELKNVRFNYDLLDQPLFDDVSLTLDESWRLGLIGRNGRGKTTLLKLLMGQLDYEGEIVTNLDFVYFPLPIMSPELPVYTAIDEVMPLELWKLERECQLLGMNKAIIWEPFSKLSGGEQTRVMLAALFCDNDRFALLDEPTNHLDLQGRRQLADYLQKKRGYIVVSHDRHFLDTVIDHTLVIERSQIALYHGDFSTYEEQKQFQDQFELDQNKSLKSEIARIEQSAKEKSNWGLEREKPSGNDPFGNAIAKRMMKRGKAIEQRAAAKIEEKKKLLKNIEKISDLTIHCVRTHRNPVLRVKNFTLRYGDEPLFEPISFELFQGEQVAITGPNGSGKTTLLHYLQGKRDGVKASGEILIPQGITKSTVSQTATHHGLLKDFAEKHAIDYSLFLNHLRILGFTRDVFQVPIEEMSEGQKKKVELSKSLGIEAEWYLWDEPLNYLDVYNQQQLEKMIKEHQPTLLFVEHDHVFVERVACKVVELK
ncbi:ribosomal protection-like ABC-F family protein [Jeotgalibacillus aurantiacus]|uniref:ribosomal protection-like ABC-F family protein n=1 Tax=Jeotgalibacillus aurantiacus TaxID=2763266 RepID=UPI001D0B7648|nr:ABC-F family ATP-binding cassette domain-containing protein [Jeotgalibacillus aurantiacus]